MIDVVFIVTRMRVMSMILVYAMPLSLLSTIIVFTTMAMPMIGTLRFVTVSMSMFILVTRMRVVVTMVMMFFMSFMLIVFHSFVTMRVTMAMPMIRTLRLVTVSMSMVLVIIHTMNVSMIVVYTVCVTIMMSIVRVSVVFTLDFFAPMPMTMTWSYINQLLSFILFTTKTNRGLRLLHDCEKIKNQSMHL